MQPQKIFRNKLKGRINRNLLSSPYTYRLAKEIFIRKGSFDFEAKKILTTMALEQAARAYRQKEKVTWTTAFFPSEMIYLFDLAPFAPEVAAGAAASFEVAPELLQEAEYMGLSSDCCSFHRCAAAGAALDYFPLPRFLTASAHLCDGASRLFQYMAERYNRPLYMLDIPARDNCRAVQYIAAQLEQIARELELQTGTKLTGERINKVFAYANEARRHQLTVNRIRQSRPLAISGDEGLGYVYLLFLGSGHPQAVDIWKTLAEELKTYGTENVDSGSPDNQDQVRLIWLHLRPYHSSELISYLEKELNACIVMEEVNLVYWPPLDPEKPFESLARKILANPGLGPLDRRLDSIEKMVGDYNAHGVIHFSHWGCRQSVGGTLLLKKHLKKKQIPFLNLDGDCIDGSSFPWGQAQTRIDSFYELIKQ